jgi:hypothetical protein
VLTVLALAISSSNEGKPTRQTSTTLDVFDCANKVTLLIAALMCAATSSDNARHRIRDRTCAGTSPGADP